MTHELDDLAAELLGIESLRDHQIRAVRALTDGSDALVVAPTGGGKSAIYQLAATVLPGATVVVSPLLALQADQHDAIEASQLPPAATIDGSTASEERDRIIAELAEGTVEFLLVTPETLLSGSVLDRLGAVDVSLLVVDEAHCIAIDGHGFRPDYLLLAEARRRLGEPQVLALSASVDPHVRREISASLGLDDPEIIVTDLARDELHLSLRRFPSRTDARSGMVADLVESDVKTLVYVPRRRLCDEIADELSAAGRPARAFHGGLGADERDDVLDHLRSEAGAVVVATTAFGLGIDIPDVRLVAHLDLPESLVAYYQEIGRAGRDGAPSRAVAYASTRKRSRRAFAGGVRPTDPDDCAAVYAAVAGGAASRRALARTAELSTGRAVRALHVLARLGAVELAPALAVSGPPPSAEDVEAACIQREDYSRSLRDGVERYLTVDRCRWSQLLGVFGQTAPACGHCDVCDRDGASTPADPLVGREVEHPDFGPGRIMTVDGDLASVTFDRVGAKDLHLPTSLDAGLVVQTT